MSTDSFRRARAVCESVGVNIFDLPDETAVVREVQREAPELALRLQAETAEDLL
jgi:hypothetical protein